MLKRTSTGWTVRAYAFLELFSRLFVLILTSVGFKVCKDDFTCCTGLHHYSMYKPNGIKTPHCRDGYFLPRPDLWEERMQRSTPGFLSTFAQLSPSVSYPPPVSPHCLLPRLWYWVVRVAGPERRHGYTRVLTWLARFEQRWQMLFF